MRKNFVSKFVQLAMISFVASGVSIASYANGHSHKSNSEVKRALASDLQKNQFSYISKKLTEHNLPKNLALIPVIESHYNAHAVSNQGAGGLWQLMPATARENGISSQGRFQLEPSTTAALNYFKKLHRKFHNWEFAIAAYNAGDGRVQRALAKNPSATSVQQLNLPTETKQYVQKFYRAQNDLRSYNA
jgi:membrane-bound lytic murein transglycosylase D